MIYMLLRTAPPTRDAVRQNIIIEEGEEEEGKRWRGRWFLASRGWKTFSGVLVKALSFCYVLCRDITA